MENRNSGKGEILSNDPGYERRIDEIGDVLRADVSGVFSTLRYNVERDSSRRIYARFNECG